jgi:hypothetical protein
MIFSLYEIHKVIHLSQLAIAFSHIQATSSRKPFFQAPVLGCRRFSNHLECAERHSIPQRPAHKLQQRNVSQCSRCFVAKFALLGFRQFASIKLNFCASYLTVIRTAPVFMHFQNAPIVYAQKKSVI